VTKSFKDKETLRAEVLREQINASLEKAEQLKTQEMLRRRIDIARGGAKAYALGKHNEAVQQFHLYLRLVEEWKGVKQGQLSPNHFDKKKDLAEIILITSIYWDLAKIYDRSKSKNVVAEVVKYLERCVLFSKSFPHEPLTSESMRKYINKNKPVHKDAFKQVYKRYGRKDCFVVTALEDVTEQQTIEILRAWRDDVLADYWLGQVLINFYYVAGPVAARGVTRLPLVIRKGLGSIFDRWAQIIVRASQNEKV